MTWITEQKAIAFWQQRIAEQTEAKEYFQAAKWMAERHLYRDMCELNAKGISPPAQVLFDLFVVNWQEDILNDQVGAYLERLSTSESARFVLVARLFRQTWLATSRILPQRPPLEDKELKRKARGLFIFKFLNRKTQNI